MRPRDPAWRFSGGWEGAAAEAELSMWCRGSVLEEEE